MYVNYYLFTILKSLKTKYHFPYGKINSLLWNEMKKKSINNSKIHLINSNLLKGFALLFFFFERLFENALKKKKENVLPTLSNIFMTIAWLKCSLKFVFLLQRYSTDINAIILNLISGKNEWAFLGKQLIVAIIKQIM